MGVQERAQARHLPGDPSSSVQGQPLVLKLEVVGLALGYTTLIVKVVNPVHAYDRWWVSFISRPPQMESRGGVQNLLSDLSFVETEDPGMDFLDFRKILFVQLEPSLPEGSLRRSGQGCGLSLIGFQFLLYFGGCGTILGTACRGLVAVLQSLRGSLTLKLQGGCSSSGVGSSALSESVLEASLICSWTC